MNAHQLRKGCVYDCRRVKFDVIYQFYDP